MKLRSFGLLLLFWLVGLIQTKSVMAKTSINFAPSNLKRDINAEFLLFVNVDTTEKLMGFDLDISYDPKTLSVLRADTGDFFTDRQTLPTLIDQNNGQVSFSQYSPSGRVGTGSLLQLTAKIIAATSSSTLVKIEKTSVFAGVDGKKIIPSIGQAIISSTGRFQESNLDLSPYPTSSTIIPTYSSKEPTIVVQQDIPSPVVKKTNGSLAVIVTLVVFLLGVAALVLIKFKRSA